MKKLVQAVLLALACFTSAVSLATECPVAKGVEYSFEFETQSQAQMKVAALQSLAQACFVEKKGAKNTMLILLSKSQAEQSALKDAGYTGLSLLVGMVVGPLGGITGPLLADSEKKVYEVTVILYDPKARGGQVMKTAFVNPEKSDAPTPEEFQAVLDRILLEFPAERVPQ